MPSSAGWAGLSCLLPAFLGLGIYLPLALPPFYLLLFDLDLIQKPVPQFLGGHLSVIFLIDFKFYWTIIRAYLLWNLCFGECTKIFPGQPWKVETGQDIESIALYVEGTKS